MNRAQRRAAGISNKNDRKTAQETRRRQMLTTLTLTCSGFEGICGERTAVPFTALRNPVEFNATLENQGWSVGVTEGYDEDLDHLNPLCGACALKAFSDSVPETASSDLVGQDTLLHGLLDEFSSSSSVRNDNDETDNVIESAPN